ncbi:SDR family oxidoreductase [Actinoplanes sp. N902-109]|uniref:SDR family oxidoreductase n=1 Tax=Actinoplanes sp. (strain N902-109) TaxID=649831 RepID=UPI0003295F3A|nr:SDR family NAD(P)-dependent oxidoreductase [Actinoplanes sp. N902-109]AGL16583.1 short-chain dehydrogenase/reductase SDR [Actinoplanes sp. N902-109]
MEPQALAGTVALVTGASSGIGQQIAEDLARQGAAVALVARRTDRIEAHAARLRAGGARAEAFPADVTDVAAGDLIEQVIARMGRLDTLVHAAGVMLVGPAVEADVAEWRRTIDLNVSAVLELTHAALPHLRQAAQTSARRVADLVTISSVAGRTAFGGAAVYSASKFAVTAFSEALRQELGRDHVRVSAVEPGAVDTELTAHIRDGVREAQQAWYASLETLQARDVAEAVTFVVTRPRHAAVAEVRILPTEQQ